MTTKKIGVLIGSLRKESFSRKIAKILMTLTPASIEMEEVGINEIAIYNQDSTMKVTRLCHGQLFVSV